MWIHILVLIEHLHWIFKDILVIYSHIYYCDIFPINCSTIFGSLLFCLLDSASLFFTGVSLLLSLWFCLIVLNSRITPPSLWLCLSVLNNRITVLVWLYISVLNFRNAPLFSVTLPLCLTAGSLHFHLLETTSLSLTIRSLLFCLFDSPFLFLLPGRLLFCL